MRRNCKFCGKEFIVTDTKHLQKYCSDECRKEYTKQYYREYKRNNPAYHSEKSFYNIKPLQRTCACCGSYFKPKRYNQKYCCAECRIRSRAKQSKTKYKKWKLQQDISKKKVSNTGFEYHLLTPEQKLFYGEAQMKHYADDFKVTIPAGLKKAKDRQNGNTL